MGPTRLISDGGPLAKNIAARPRDMWSVQPSTIATLATTTPRHHVPVDNR